MAFINRGTELLREAIYEYILRSGAAGLTDEEIGDYLQVVPRSVRTHRYALLCERRIMAMHPRRVVSSGRKATVWLSTRIVKKLLNNRTITI